MPVEAILGEYEKQRQIIAAALAEQDRLIDSLKKAGGGEWDLVTVKVAAMRSGLSTSTIYRFIDDGKLRAVHKGGRKYVSNAELVALDDKFEG